MTKPLSLLDMEDIEEEELLNLSLAIATPTPTSTSRTSYSNEDRIVNEDQNTKKRKRMVVLSPFMSSYNQDGHHEDMKILRLLQMREQMHHKNNDCKQKASPKQTLMGVDEDGKGLHLIHLLLMTATAVDENNVASALENLTQLYLSVSLTSASVQRVVAYFADGLVARLLTRKSPFYEMIMKDPTSDEEFLAFTKLYRVSPFYQFAHFTANQNILEAFEREEQSNNRALHVIDFHVSYGFQWPSLIQSLSEMATSSNRISLQITGFGRSWEELQETESRLVGFSKGFSNIFFEFRGMLRGSSSMVNLRMKKNETIAVNLVLHSLNDFLKTSDTLNSLHSINPSVVVLVEQEVGRNPRSFLLRFMESLHYYAAMFDSLDDFLPLESIERLNIEKNHLGKEIKRMVNYDKFKKTNHTSTTQSTWEKVSMESHGFRAMRLSSKSLIQAKLLLKIRTNHSDVNGESIGGFRVFERDEGKSLCLCWQDRSLLTASAWHCL